MPWIAEKPATVVASVVSPVLLAYTALTPTNVLIGLLPVVFVLVGARLVDRDHEPVEPATRRK